MNLTTIQDTHKLLSAVRTEERLSILQLVYRKPGITRIEIFEQLIISHGSGAHMLLQMIRAGLLTVYKKRYKVNLSRYYQLLHILSPDKVIPDTHKIISRLRSHIDDHNKQLSYLNQQIKELEAV